MADRIKGVNISIYDNDWDVLFRQYQDPEGWYVTDSGLNEDESGYYFHVEARGVNREIRRISLTLTQDALNTISDRVNSRKLNDDAAARIRDYNTKTYASGPTTVSWTTNEPEGDVTVGEKVSGCCGGSCGSHICSY